jgi:hypothetical protein
MQANKIAAKMPVAYPAILCSIAKQITVSNVQIKYGKTRIDHIDHILI